MSTEQNSLKNSKEGCKPDDNENMDTAAQWVLIFAAVFFVWAVWPGNDKASVVSRSSHQSINMTLDQKIDQADKGCRRELNAGIGKGFNCRLSQCLSMAKDGYRSRWCKSVGISW